MGGGAVSDRILADPNSVCRIRGQSRLLCRCLICVIRRGLPCAACKVFRIAGILVVGSANVVTERKRERERERERERGRHRQIISIDRQMA
jgi:hypothetical protein